MTLATGTRLESYQILESIGAGGMGEVYRSRDTKLKRDVAIKVLPEALSKDEERLTRFEREARLLASLNHPNIATLFDFDETDGTHFLALEFVEGETLAEQIQRGALGLDRALPLFKQIAEALEAAHEKGIIHRDLKPANIKVTPEGKVKVLDFGLAKALTGESPARDQSESPTITRDGTMTGVLLGTAPYMSPEQARGKAVHKRTDIWAFGCVLFEALAGKKAFGGETVTDTIANIVKTEPDWNELPATTPWRVRDLLARCLRKDPAQRLREIGSARLDVDDAMAEVSGRVPAVPAPAGAPLWWRSLPMLAAAAILGGLVVGLTVWGLTRSETTPPPRVIRLTVRLPSTDELNLVGITNSVNISPDGSHIIYWGKRDGNPQLLLRPLDELEATPVRGTEWVYHPFFSPDGQWIGFFDRSDGWKLKRVPLAGGPPVLICDVPPFADGATWGPNDTIFFGSRRSGLWSVPSEGGAPQRITIFDSDDKDYRWPHILPDGKTLLVTERRSEIDGGQRIVAVNVETGEVRTLLERGTYAHYASSGHLVFHRAGSLMAVPFDPDGLEVHGPPVQVLDKVRNNSASLADYAISRDGSLVYVNDDEYPPSNLVWVDRDGHSRPLTGGRRFYRPRLSPDGNRALLSIREEGSMNNTWLYDLSRDTLTRVTFEGRQDVQANTSAIWTPDGERVTFCSVREEDSRLQIYSMAADGSGQVERLTPSGGWRTADSWSPDGKVLAYTEIPDGGGADIGLLSLEGEPELLPFLQTPFWESQAIFSPGGEWIAYTSDESGRLEVYVRPYPGPGEKVQISNNGGEQPLWVRDGQELYYRSGDRMMAVPVDLGPTFTAGQPSLIFEGDYEMGNGIWTNYDVSPDGNAFLMIERTTEAPRQINVVLNWHQELLEKVPVK